MSAAPGTIPYEKQLDTRSTRMCGAACLSMVYRSFGKDVPQAEIWPKIAKVNRLGSLASTTHLMAQDALGRELAAVAFQARHPIQALRLCREAGARAILNHRAEMNSPNGHYSVMVDLDARNVYLHDPYYGPSRVVSHADLLELWEPKFSNSEIVGGVLIAIADAPPDVPPCQFCRTPFKAAIDCPHCGKAVSLKPATVLGCLNENCIARMWNYICCPFCDFMWNSSTSVAPASAGVPGSSAGNPASAGVNLDPAILDRMYDAVDKFFDEIKKIPGALDNPMIKEQVDHLAVNKIETRKAFETGAMHTRAFQDKLAEFAAAAAAKGEAHRQKLAEMEAAKPKAAQPLDGVALGKALLKNLGFTQ